MRIGLVAAIFSLLASGASAADDGATAGLWTIGKVSGRVYVEAPNHERMVVKANRFLYPGQTLVTGTRTRVMLTNGRQKLRASSNTRLSIPQIGAVKPGITQINHRSGTIHLIVDKKRDKHFEVHTPHMVAAVKGTEFTVSIGQQDTNLRVHEGLVEVTNNFRDEVFDVGQGESVVMALTTSSARKSSALVPGLAVGRPDSNLIFVERGETPDEVGKTIRRKSSASAFAPASFGELVSAAGIWFVNTLGWGFNAIISGLVGLVMMIINPILAVLKGLSDPLRWGIFAVLIGTAGTGAFALGIVIYRQYAKWRRSRWNIQLHVGK